MSRASLSGSKTDASVIEDVIFAVATCRGARDDPGRLLQWPYSHSWGFPRLDGSKRRNRGDDFLCRDDSAGVVRQVDVERGVHRLVRVIRCRVLYYGDLIAEFSGIADSRFDTGVCNQPDDD